MTLQGWVGRVWRGWGCGEFEEWVGLGWVRVGEGGWGRVRVREGGVGSGLVRGGVEREQVREESCGERSG